MGQAEAKQKPSRRQWGRELGRRTQTLLNTLHSFSAGTQTLFMTQKTRFRQTDSTLSACYSRRRRGSAAVLSRPYLPSSANQRAVWKWAGSGTEEAKPLIGLEMEELCHWPLTCDGPYFSSTFWIRSHWQSCRVSFKISPQVWKSGTDFTSFAACEWLVT